MANDNVAFVTPWWLNITFFFFSFSCDGSIRDLSSQKKLDLLTAMLLFRRGRHLFSPLIRPVSLALACRFCQLLSHKADFLLCSGHTAVVLPWWCLAPGYHWPQLWPFHWFLSGFGRREEIRLPISYLCPQPTLAQMLFSTASSSLSWRQTTAAWQWVSITFIQPSIQIFLEITDFIFLRGLW